jgi:hypothetical protein
MWCSARIVLLRPDSKGWTSPGPITGKKGHFEGPRGVEGRLWQGGLESLALLALLSMPILAGTAWAP